MLLGDIVTYQAKSHPEKIAVADENVGRTWGEIHQRTNSLARALRGLGAKPGDRVAILDQNCHQYPESVFSIAKSGMVAVPVNWRFTSREISYVLNNSDSKIVIVGGDYVDLLESMKSDLKSLEHIICISQPKTGMHNYEELIQENSREGVEAGVSEQDMAFLIYTSGTTGFPKGVIITHKNLISIATNYAIAYRLHPEDITLSVAPLFHIGAESVSISHWYMGCTNIIHRTFKPSEWLKTVEKERVTTALLLPTMCNMVLNEVDISKHDFSSLRLIIHSGEVMPAARTLKGMDVFGADFVEIYGSTECASSTYKMKEKALIENPQEPPPWIVSCGRDFFNTETNIFDKSGKILGPGGQGEIAIKGDPVTPGYWKLPEENKNRFKGGWLFMGDIGRLDSGGNLYVVDRKDDMIISGGENIYPREIEEVLSKHPDVAQAAVIGVPDERWGQAVTACIIPREKDKLTVEDIKSFSKKHLAGYKCPKYIDFYEKLPQTPAGKILKRELKKKYMEK